MNDERFKRTVGAWLHDEDPAPPDSFQSARRVAARLPLVRQQSRWWPLPLLRRTPTPTWATDTIDYQPSPTPATNGHTPTVIGRTRSMLSPAKAITAGALVFAVGGVMLIAQPFQQQTSVPGAAIDACTTPIVYVAGHIIWGDEEPGTEVFTTGRDSHLRGAVYVNTMDLDDDRLDGPGTTNLDWDITGGGRSNDTVRRGSIHIENEAGAWEGSFHGIGQWEKLRNVLSVTGSGGYEGLSATLLHVSNDDIGGVIEGAIYPTDIASCDFG